MNVPLLIALATFTALRLPLLTRPALPLGWNSDAAIFGLMARSIFERGAFPIYFFGQSYMGPLTSWSAVLFAIFTRSVTPLELRLGVMLLNAAAIVFYWLALRRTFNERAAALAILWIAIGPDYVMRFAIAPIGAEQLFFVSSVLFWFATKTMLATRRDCFLFGVLSGFGWWIHQGVVFVIAAVLLVIVARSEWSGGLQPAWHRHWRAATRVSLVVRALQILLAIDALLGALVEFGVHAPALFLVHPVAEPAIAILLLEALMLMPRVRRPRLDYACALAAGALIGYAPVIAGRLLHAFPDRYSADAALLALPDLLPHMAEVVRDVVPFAGNVAVAIVIVPAFVCAVIRFRSDSGARAIALATIAFAFTFYFVSARAHAGQMRYIVAALPLVYAFAAEQLVRHRWLAVGGALIVTVALLVARVEQVRDVVRGNDEAYGGFLQASDPRAELASIRAAKYRVCYADYWLAYKLEWLSGGDVRFIPRPGYDRRPAESVRLNALPIPKCYVDLDGRVRPATPVDVESGVSRRARERLRRMGAESLAAPALR